MSRSMQSEASNQSNRERPVSGQTVYRTSYETRSSYQHPTLPTGPPSPVSTPPPPLPKTPAPDQNLASNLGDPTTSHRTHTTHVDYVQEVRPVMSAHSVVINRSNTSGYGLHGPIPFGRNKMQSTMLNFPVEAYTVIANNGVGTVKETRVREKKDMQDLNERLANYIEKVRFLEAQNRKLADELEKLKAKWGQETSRIRAMYQVELDEARKLLDDALKDRARLEIRCASQDDQISELKQRLNDVNTVLTNTRASLDDANRHNAELEVENMHLKKRVGNLEGDKEMDKKQIGQLQNALNRTRSDLDNETLLHVDAESRRQTLEEELEFLKLVHEQELKELSALIYRDTTSENREFWKNEMGQALREIQTVYDSKIDAMRDEIEMSYNLKIQEFRAGANRQLLENSHSKEECKRLKNQMKDLQDKLSALEMKNSQLSLELEHLRQEKERMERSLEQENDELKRENARLRAEMAAVMKELQEIVDSKLGLELEIAAYRKLLEGEEGRIATRSRGFVNNSSHYMESESSNDHSLGINQVIRGEMSARTTYQRTAKGPCSITECSSDGKYIVLENSGRKDEQLGNWKIKRNVDGFDRVEYTLDRNFILRALGKVKIWVQGAKPANSSSNDIETSLSTWYPGSNVMTKLLSTTGEEKAAHIQKTVYA